jgi:PKD repeat protein
MSCNLPKNLLQSSACEETQTDEPDAMLKWERDRVKNPITGEIPIQNLVKVYQQSLQQTAQAPVSGIQWTERGPNNIGGRTRVVMFDKKDTSYKKVFAASVGGGLFVCDDITATTPTWSKLDDFFSNLAITCMAQNPNHPDTIFFGTGEGFGNADALRGAGVWRSADGGVTWSQLASSMNGSVPTYIIRLAITTQGVIYAATSSGLFKSTNGNTWTTVLRTSGTTPTVGSNSGKDVKIATNDDIYYSCTGQVWKYTNATATWSNVTPSGSYGRIEIACAPSDSNFVYLMCQSGSASTVTGFFSSNDKGSTWRSRTVPVIYDQAATASTEISRLQAWYDLSLAVDPTTPTTVYAGAIDYIKSLDTGATYKQISAWSLYAMPGAANLGSSQVMHSDHHTLVFRPGSNAFALMGCDGGLYRSTNMSNTWPSVPSYATINTDYNVTQLYGCAMANTAGSNNFLGGAQDNGSLKYNASGINSVTSVSGGDGCYCFIDQANSNNQITSYVYNNYYISTNASTFTAISGANNTGDFVNSGDLDGVNDILYSKTATGTISRWSSVFGSVSKTNLVVTGVSGISHIKVSPNDPTTIYLGTGSGSVYRITGANSATTPITPTLLNSSSFGGRISSIEIRKCAAATDDTILVTQSNYGLGNSVLVTTNALNATPTWTDIDDNSTLPDIPVNWCLFAPTTSAKEAMLATEMGIYTCDDIYAATPVWGQSNTGFANVRVDMLKFRTADSLIAAATHGRGLYTCDKYKSPVSSFSANKLLAYISNPIVFSDASTKATSWEWDFDNNGSVDATTQNPTWAYGSPGLKTVKLTINGVYSKTVTNYIQILPNMPVPYTTAQGGDFESNATDFAASLIAGTGWEKGNSSVSGKSGVKGGSNAWVTGLTATTYAINSEAYLYTPNFNLSNAANDSIKFYLKNSFEIGYDGVRVEYSIDKGLTWAPLSTSTATNWYDYANSSTTTSFAQNQAYFNATNSSYTLKKYSLSALNGNVDVAFRFAFKSDNSTNTAGAAIDNFEIVSSVASIEYKNIETAATSKAESFGPSATVDFYSSNGKMLATLINNSAHDYGLTTITIDNAGNGASNYGSNTDASKRIAQKTFAISPTNNNASGSYTIKIYYTAAEMAGWRSITGNTFANANIIKCPTNIASGTLANGVYGTGVSYTLTGVSDTVVSASFSTGFSGFGVGTDGVVLPITLVSFEVTAVNNDAVLAWSTATERNNKMWEIERSVDGIVYTKIAEEPGYLNSFVLRNYQYIDQDILLSSGVVYYRIKQVDENGTYKYSPVRIVHKLKQFSTFISIYPQPASNILNIVNKGSEPFNYFIYNMDGKLAMQGESKVSKLQINISQLAMGNYIIRINEGQLNAQNIHFTKINEQ